MATPLYSVEEARSMASDDLIRRLTLLTWQPSSYRVLEEEARRRQLIF